MRKNYKNMSNEQIDSPLLFPYDKIIKKQEKGEEY